MLINFGAATKHWSTRSSSESSAKGVIRRTSSFVPMSITVRMLCYSFIKLWLGHIFSIVCGSGHPMIGRKRGLWRGDRRGLPGGHGFQGSLDKPGLVSLEHQRLDQGQPNSMGSVILQRLFLSISIPHVLPV